MYRRPCGPHPAGRVSDSASIRQWTRHPQPLGEVLEPGVGNGRERFSALGTAKPETVAAYLAEPRPPTGCHPHRSRHRTCARDPPPFRQRSRHTRIQGRQRAASGRVMRGLTRRAAARGPHPEATAAGVSRRPSRRSLGLAPDALLLCAGGTGRGWSGRPVLRRGVTNEACVRTRRTSCVELSSLPTLGMAGEPAGSTVGDRDPGRLATSRARSLSVLLRHVEQGSRLSRGLRLEVTVERPDVTRSSEFNALAYPANQHAKRIGRLASAYVRCHRGRPRWLPALRTILVNSHPISPALGFAYFPPLPPTDLAPVEAGSAERVLDGRVVARHLADGAEAEVAEGED